MTLCPHLAGQRKRQPTKHHSSALSRHVKLTGAVTSSCLSRHWRGGMRRLAQRATPVNDTIDMRVALLIYQGVIKGYAWNGQKYPSEIRISERASLVAEDRKLAKLPDVGKPHFVSRRLGRDRGIIFQDASMGTDVDGAFIVAAEGVGERVSEEDWDNLVTKEL